MMLTVEISMYPLQENYRSLIGEFIERLNQYPDFRIATSDTSTTVIGDYHGIMSMLTELMQWSCQTHGRAVFVTKFIPGYDPARP
ncbi:MAG: hypothetical protein WD601_12475 [Pseudohongiellaceae bacterium]